jgi:hypothetical protein
MKAFSMALIALAAIIHAAPAFCQGGANTAATSAGAMPPGTEINMQNWRSYQEFMPDGMVALFQGQYYWKMPPDVQMDVGPTIIHPLPKSYLEATEKYAQQVKIVELSDGGPTLQGYQGANRFQIRRNRTRARRFSPMSGTATCPILSSIPMARDAIRTALAALIAVRIKSSIGNSVSTPIPECLR